MSTASQKVVFFDLVRTLGVERAAPNGGRMVRFSVYPEVPTHLEVLGQGARLGVLVIDPDLRSEQVERTLGGPGLEGFFDDSLLLLSRPAEPDPFARALRQAGLEDAPERAVYVGSQAAHRERAHGAGMRVAPHLALAPAVLDGQDLHYLRVAAPTVESGHSWAPVIRELPIVPLLGEREPEPVLYAIAAESALVSLRRSFDVEQLGRPSDVAETAPYLLQVTDEEGNKSARLREFLSELPHQLPLVRETPGGWLIAVPGSRLVDEFHPPDVGPGHNRALILSCVSLQEPPPGDEPDEGERRGLVARAGWFVSPEVGPAEEVELAQVDAGLVQQYVDLSLAVPSRHIKHFGNEQATSFLAAAVEQICGSTHTFLYTFGQVDGRNLYNIEGEIPGDSSETVIVGAHFDSTAPYPPPGSSSSYTYNPAQGLAPGADDNASGVAGVLAAAKALKALFQTASPKRTIRFLLFNAEEQGLLGSQAYAKDLKAFDVPVAAMFQMDMIGWVSGPYPSGSFEVHGAGAMDYPKAYQASNELADLVRATAAQVSPGLVPQIYPLAGKVHDPAAARSDQGSFHYHDWPACLVAEDLYPEAGEAPSNKPKNPAYHTPADSTVNTSYAADVARAVAGTAWKVAGISSTRLPRLGPRTNDGLSGQTVTYGGGGPMPDKFLVKFLADWIVDPQLRCEVLYQEQTKLQEWGLTTQQRQALLSLEYATILELIKQEFMGLGVDLDTAKGEIGNVSVGTTGGGSTDAMMVSSMMYQEGAVHVRGVTPVSIAAGIERCVTIRGQGFNCQDTVEVKFEKGGIPKTGTVIGEVACDIDIYQRVTVQVEPLDAGNWLVKARNAGDPDWSTDYVLLKVT